MLDWSNPPFAKWFVGGKLNAAYNCVDRHVEAGNGDKVAYHWIGEPGRHPDLTYADLKDKVCQAANALIELGVRDGRPGRHLHADDPRDRDRDAGVRPDRRPAHGGLRRVLRRRARGRIQDCDARVVITADGGYRRGAPSALKPAVDEAVKACPDVRTCWW